ncbi:O-antigen ligase like membrane protein [Methylobacterium sp. 174MFSha1.1]|uniref:O-antigen ligase family protein n=1 Tax=Methylobacterium sp. 174MFSha1.1 TaxID=1502749 RepID=UPI0008EB00DF|nr:O-antigen ligase family protein [Methylobacterium sp. 174MFSha1.1]SFV16238.1 O-antigen ligase like membrane protein [Methylobacterium sp. 174MFSha1.1]
MNTLLSISLFFPSAMKLIDSPLINVNRLVIIILSVISVTYFFQTPDRTARKIVITDIFVTLFAIILFYSTILNDGIGKPLASTAIPVLEFCGAYIAARALVVDQAGFDRVARAYVAGCLAAIACALIDLAIGSVVVNNIFASATGNIPIPSTYRLGLLRASSTQEHAILFGCMCSLGICFVQPATFSWQDKLLLSLLMIFGAILSLSAAPIIASTLIFSWFCLRIIVKKAAYRVFALIFIGLTSTTFLIILDLDLSQFLSMVTFENSSGTFRFLIWRYVIAEIEFSPWTGIGYRDWSRPNDMPDSVDSLWLFLTMRYGLIAILILVLAMVSAFFHRRFINILAANSAEWMTVGLWTLAFCGLTVHLWGSAWMMFGVLMGCRVGLGTYEHDK